jgi:hypothetical protein
MPTLFKDKITLIVVLGIFAPLLIIASRTGDWDGLLAYATIFIIGFVVGKYSAA